MILMGTNPFGGPLEEVGPENRDFLGPEMAGAMLVPFGPRKVEGCVYVVTPRI